MQCLWPVTIRSETIGIASSARCGKCLPCRIARRSSWVSRCLLESRTSATSSFWTLTFASPSEHLGYRLVVRDTLRTFSKALQMSERRAGNHLPIRFYGCSEYGGNFGRPHCHLMIFNLIKNYREPIRYLRGLPRPRIHIPQWPHGHIDVAEFNNRTLNYVTEYLTDFSHLKQSTPGLEPVPFRSRLPAIGFSGISALAVSTVRQRATLSEWPRYLVIQGRNYPLDQYTLQTFRKVYLREGGRYRPQGDPKTRQLLKLQEAASLSAQTPQFLKDREYDQLRQIMQSYEKKRQEKQLTEQAITDIYLRFANNTKKQDSPSDRSTEETT